MHPHPSAPPRHRWLRRLTVSPCAALALFLLGPSPAQATPQPMFAGYNTGNGPWGYSLGTRFTTGPDYVSVSKLGFFDRDQDGLASSHQVALYDPSNIQVAYAVIPAGTVGELIGDFRYVELGSALLLSPNTTYTLMAAVNGDSVPETTTFTAGFSAPNFNGFIAVAAWAANDGGTTVKAPGFKWGNDGNVCTTGNLIGVPSLTLHTITASVTGSGGTITPSGDVLVADGGSQTFTITPDFGYVIADVLVDGGNVGVVTTYPFNSVTGAHTIAASFSALPSVMISGTVSVGGVATDAATVNLYTDSACVNLVTSTDTASGGTYSISVPQSSTCYLKATKSGFVSSEPLEVVTGTEDLPGQDLNITSRRYEAEDPANTRVNVGNSSDAGASGGFRVAKLNQSAFAGVTFNSVNVAETGFYTLTLRYYGFGDNRMTEISVNGAPVSGSPFVCNVGGYATLAPVPVLLAAGDNSVVIGRAGGDWGPHWDCIDVSTDYTPATLHTITASVTGSGGTITPSGDVTVVDSTSQTFTITPDFGYGIADVLVDGGSVGPVTTYPFNSVTGAHTITASFSELPAAMVSGTVSVGGVATDVATVHVYTDSACVNLVASADTVAGGTYTVSVPQNSTCYLKASKSGFAPSAPLEVVTGTGDLSGQDLDLIIRRYEAEDAALVNCGIPGDFNELASGGKRASGSENAAVLTFSVYAQTAGDYPIVMGYFQPWDGNRDTTVTVNGTALPNIPAPHVPSPNYGKSSATFPLVAGVNSVVLSNIGVGWGPHWDYIDIPQPIYIANATAGIGGSISPSGGTFIVPGAGQTFTFTAAPGYLLDEVLVDGVNDPSAVTSGSLTFSGVNEDHQIIASFVTPPSDPYQTWADGFFSVGDPDAAKNTDPDLDGVRNLLEFAFGTDPTVPSTGPIEYTPGVSGSIIQRGQPVLVPNTLHPPYFSAVFGRRWDELAAGLAYTVQFSSDLRHWVDVAPSAEPQDPYDSEIEVVEVPFPTTITIDPGSGPVVVIPQFFRVLVADAAP